MMWQYAQATGRLMHNGVFIVAEGYSGCGAGKNNPEMADVKCVGPIPKGMYVTQPPVDTKTHGPFVMWLVPSPTNEMHGRSAFGIHGDSRLEPGSASEGCIVLPRATREQIWNSGDTQLEVI